MEDWKNAYAEFGTIEKVVEYDLFYNINFLKIKLSGPPENRNAIGAKVEISYNGQRQRVDLSPARGYLSTVDHVLHFGLGASNKVEGINVSWPDGQKTQLKNPKINRVIKVKYASSYVEKSVQTATAPFFEDISLSVGLSHKNEEIPFDDFAREIRARQWIHLKWAEYF